MTNLETLEIPWVVEGNVRVRVPWEFYSLKQGEKRLIMWAVNKPFKAAFKPYRFPMAYSKVKMINTANDQEFWIRPVDFEHAFYSTAVIQGVFIGEWEIRQTKGKYYGLKLA